MKKWLSRLMASFVLVLVGSFAWVHRHHVPVAPAADQSQQSEATYTEAQDAQKMVTVTGPMADYVQRQTPSGTEAGGEAKVETLQPISRKASASDHVGDSPVGTSAAILHKTFKVTGTVDVPFDVPPHASTPQLHGTYRSFAQQSSGLSSDSEADVEFLLLSEQQHSDLLSGRPADAVFAADSAHDGEVNFSLPPTLNQAARYYLVFRNGAQKQGKKVVEADFRVDF
jgi:hypothetical protein